MTNSFNFFSKPFTVFIFLFFYHHCISQPLNGLWKGQCEHSIFVLNPVEILLELEISNDTLVSGVIHSYYKKGRYDHVKITGHVNWKDSIFTIIDDKEISHNIDTRLYETCLGTMTLKLTKTDYRYRLQGKWKDNSKKLIRCPTLDTYFDKEFNTPILSLKTNEAIRKTNIQTVIEVAPDETDSIKLSLYDNGQIDNDTASVFLDDALLIKSQRLSQTPIEIIVSLDAKNKFHHIKLVAENLGSIPPNTALLIITTRRNRYTITLSSDYFENGSVEFFLKE